VNQIIRISCYNEINNWPCYDAPKLKAEHNSLARDSTIRKSF